MGFLGLSLNILLWSDYKNSYQSISIGGVSLSRIRDLLAERMTLAGGVSSITLCSGDMQRIDDSVKKALDILRPTGRFILQPVDALFPDTPWGGLQKMIEAWKHYR